MYFFSQRGFDTYGGGELVAGILSSLLKEKGINVFQATLYNKSSKAKNKTLFIASSMQQKKRRKIMSLFYDPVLTKNLKKIKKIFNIDLIYAQAAPTVAQKLVRVARKIKLPIIVAVHSWSYLCPTGYKVRMPKLIPCNSISLTECLKCRVFITGLDRSQSRHALSHLCSLQYHLLASKYVLRTANYIVAPSRIFCREIEKQLNQRCLNVPNPIDPTLLNINPHPRGDGSVLFLGRLSLIKGIPVIVNIAKRLSNTLIHVAGEGPLKLWLLEKKPPNVLYHGFVHGVRKSKLLEKTSIVIVPSLCVEMFPYVIVEAFAFAKPVIAFDLGGSKELVEMSGGGLLAKPFNIAEFADHIKYLLENKTAASKMGIRGRKWVEKTLHPDRIVKLLIRIFDKCVESL